MPRPPHTQDDPLSQLAVLAQLFPALMAPQMRQQDSRQQQALSLLGLLQQGSHQDDILKEQQNYHQGELSSAADARNLTASSEAARMAMEGQRYAEDTRHHTALEGAASAASQNQLKEAFVRSLMSDPSIPSEERQAGISALDPMLGKATQAMGQAKADSSVKKVSPAFQGIYAAGAKDPSKMKAGLDALKTTLPTEVFNNQDWEALNSSLPAGVGAPAAPRTGGLINNLFPDNRPPGVAELQQQDANNYHLSDMFSWLIGERPEVKQEKEKSAAAWEALRQQYPNHPFFTR